MKKRIAINGFGRIGRAAARIILDNFSDKLELVAINDPSPTDMTAHLFKFDTNYGTFSREISVSDDDQYLFVDDYKIKNFSTREISELPWSELNIDVVLECTGVFRTKETASAHLDSGAKKVLLSAPAKSDGFRTIVLGVNDDEIQDSDKLISNASCTTNCLAPFAKILDENFDIEKGLMTTIHAVTNDQRILDVGHKDLRRARAAYENIIPTSTGAAKAVALVYPKLKGLLNGISIRVPVPTVSLVDLTVNVKKETSAEEVNKVLQQASEKNPHIIGFETRPLVSRDFQTNTHSCIIDASETMVIGNMIKVLAWYDNEWGYSNRLVELASKL